MEIERWNTMHLWQELYLLLQHLAQRPVINQPNPIKRKGHGAQATGNSSSVMPLGPDGLEHEEGSLAAAACIFLGLAEERCAGREFSAPLP